MSKPRILWALRWYSKNNLDGIRTHVINEDCLPKLFLTRDKAREYQKEHFGYIKRRTDLRGEPHGWRCPRPVRVKILEVKP